MTDDADRTLPDLASGLRLAMVTASGDGGLRSRPLTVQKLTEDAVWFLVADDADWLDEALGEVNVALSDDSTWVSVSGRGQLVRDQALLDELGNAVTDAWFEEGKNPVALQVNVAQVDWWDSPGKLRQLVGLAKAAVTDSRPNLGDHGSTD